MDPLVSGKHSYVTCANRHKTDIKLKSFKLKYKTGFKE